MAVPTLGQIVRPEAAPNVRLSPNAPAAAFPGAVNTLPDLGGATQEVGKLASEARNEADQIAVADADAKVVRAKTAALWDPNSGAMNARGKDAISASDQAQSAFQKDAADIEDSLANDRQKQAFRRRVDMHYADLGGQLGQHVATQIKQYDHDTSLGHYAANLDAARKGYQDPTTVQSAVESTRAAATDYWRRNGHREGDGVDEYARQDIDARVSAIHAAVFDQYSNAGQDRPAASYYEAHKDVMTQADRERVEPVADAGRVRADGQEQSAAILSSSTTMPAALEDAGKIEDPDVRKDVTRRITQHYADIATGELRTRQANYQQASKILEDTGGNFDAVPLSLRRTLLPGENEALQHRADQIRHPKQYGDEGNFHRLKLLAHISPAGQQAFLQENVATGYPKLSDEQREQLVTLQQRVRASVAKAPAAPADAAPNVAGTPVPPAAPYNPMAGMSVAPEPTLHPTKKMLEDVAQYGEGYAGTLRGMGYKIPHQPAKP